MSNLGIGVVGAGFIGRVHVDAIRRVRGVEVVALAEAGEKLAQAQAAALGVRRAYGDYRALLEDPDVHVVHVCTPNRSHYEIVSAALSAGKHVVAEKPLAMTAEEAGDLESQAAKAETVNAVDFIHRGYPMIQQARCLVASGALGDVKLVHGSYLQDWLMRDTDWNWRIDEEEGGTSRALADIGSHWLDLVQAVTGTQVKAILADPITVFPVRYRAPSAGQTFNSRSDKTASGEPIPVHTEDCANVLLRFTDGAAGALTVSQVSAGRKNRLWFEIDGSEASLSWDSEQPEYLWFGRREQPNQMLQRDPSQLLEPARAYARMPGGHAEGWPDALRNIFEDVYKTVLGGQASPDGPCYATFSDGVRAIRIVEAALASARAGTWNEVVGSTGSSR